MGCPIFTDAKGPKTFLSMVAEHFHPLTNSCAACNIKFSGSLRLRNLS